MLLEKGTVIGGRYEILEKIGSGGMSLVYHAIDRKLGREITVKVLREEFLTDDELKARFKVEARSAAILIHPNIVNVYDVGEEGDIYYIIMEYVKGETLKKTIREKAPFDELTTISVAVQVAAALSHAHKNRIIHRDIKPQNIMVSTDGTIKVMDFGIARAAAVSTMTTTASAIGSVHYFSPEQARGGYVDEKSDIYSLGICMYEMITGRLPFEGDNSVSIALKHINSELPSIKETCPGISRGLEGIIKKAAAKRSSARYLSIDLMISDLRTALAEVSGDFAARKEQAASGAPVSFPGQSAGDKKVEVIEMESVRLRREKENPAAERPSTGRSAGNDGIDLPESIVGFDKYSKKLRIPMSEESAKEPRKRRGAAEDFEDEDYGYDRKEERKVVVAAIITALVIIGVISFFGIKIFMGKRGASGESAAAASMPSLLGMSISEAQEKGEEMGFAVTKSGEEESDTYEEGLIIYQSVDEGGEITEDMNVAVTVSSGLSSYNMPYVSGLSAEEAERDIKAIIPSAAIEVKYGFNDNVGMGIVINQEPEPGAQIDANTNFVLNVSKGEEFTDAAVPNVAGLTLEEAKKSIEENGLTVGTVMETESETVAKGYVMTQTLRAGDMVAKNSIVGLVVSKGPAGQAPPATQAQTTEAAPANTGGPKTIFFTIKKPDVPEGTESVDIKLVKKDSSGDSSVILETSRMVSEFPFDIPVMGSGECEVEFYVNGNFQWSEKVNFS